MLVRFSRGFGSSYSVNLRDTQVYSPGGKDPYDESRRKPGKRSWRGGELGEGKQEIRTSLFPEENKWTSDGVSVEC